MEVLQATAVSETAMEEASVIILIMEETEGTQTIMEALETVMEAVSEEIAK